MNSQLYYWILMGSLHILKGGSGRHRFQVGPFIYNECYNIKWGGVDRVLAHLASWLWEMCPPKFWKFVLRMNMEEVYWWVTIHGGWLAILVTPPDHPCSYKLATTYNYIIHMHIAYIYIYIYIHEITTYNTSISQSHTKPRVSSRHELL